MTDRVRTLTVVLDQDMRVDDVEIVTSAISMIRHVQSVTTGTPVDMKDWGARIAVGGEYQAALWDAFEKVRNKKG